MNHAERYCRLCGKLKPNDEFINLLHDDTGCIEIKRKLNRVNGAVDFTCTYLPMTVCFACLTTLESAYNFVCNVERVQDVLANVIFVHVKKEIDNTDGNCEKVPPVVSDPNKLPSKEVGINTEGFLSDLNYIGDVQVPQTDSGNGRQGTLAGKKHSIANQNVNVLEPKIEVQEMTQNMLPFALTLFPLTRTITDESGIKELSDNVTEASENTTSLENISATAVNVSTVSETSTSKTMKKKSMKSTKAISVHSESKLSWKDYSWKCSYCDLQFPSIDELKSHSMQAHECCNAYRCADCRMRKSSLQKFLQHVRKHRDYLRYSCHMCSAPCVTIAEKNKHRKKVHGKSKFSCKGCTTTFKNQAEYEKHTKTYFKNVYLNPTKLLIQHSTQGLTCLICQKSFSSLVGLRNHVFLHTERKKEHVCETCGKDFSLKNHYKQHLELHNDSQAYVCEICKAAFKAPRYLSRHIRWVHTSQETPSCKCDICGRSFRHKKTLQMHARVHSGFIPYECQYCNKSFRWKSNLTLHLRQHTGLKPYWCEDCQRTFTNSGNYNKHMKTRHGIDTRVRKKVPDSLTAGIGVIPTETGQLTML